MKKVEDWRERELQIEIENQELGHHCCSKHFSRLFITECSLLSMHLKYLSAKQMNHVFFKSAVATTDFTLMIISNYFEISKQFSPLWRYSKQTKIYQWKPGKKRAVAAFGMLLNLQLSHTEWWSHVSNIFHFKASKRSNSETSKDGNV